MKDGTYVVNLDEYKSIGMHWITLYTNDNSVAYLLSFGVEHIPEEINGSGNIITNVFRIQDYDSIMYGYICIGFLDFMLKDKTLIDFANLLSPHNFDKNDKIL